MQTLILGGGMTYTFVKAHGGDVGTSICEPDFLETALAIEKKAAEKKEAKKKGLPPFVIFLENSLQDMSTHFPTTLEDLENLL